MEVILTVPDMAILGSGVFMLLALGFVAGRMYGLYRQDGVLGAQYAAQVIREGELVAQADTAARSAQLEGQRGRLMALVRSGDVPKRDVAIIQFILRGDRS
jgi:hypothetical protein